MAFRVENPETLIASVPRMDGPDNMKIEKALSEAKKEGYTLLHVVPQYRAFDEDGGGNAMGINTGYLEGPWFIFSTE